MANIIGTEFNDNNTIQLVFENGRFVRKLFRSIDGTNDADTIDALGGNDIVFANGGTDFVNGNAGNDTINGGDGDDRLDGGIGDDTINGDAGKDILRGEDGKDNLNGGNGDDTIEGGNGDDILNGGADNDSLFGNFGRDFFVASQGNDTIRGGTDNPAAGEIDIINYDSINEAITFKSTGATLFNKAGADGTVTKGTQGTDTLFEIERVFGKAGLQNTIDVFGTASNIAVNVDLDGESLRFTSSNIIDSYIVRNFVNVNGSAQKDVIKGDEFTNILNGNGGDDDIFGGNFGQDILNGGDGKDKLRGSSDSNILNGDAGDDTLDGGDGNDILEGGLGADKFLGNRGNDTITDISGAAGTTVDTADYTFSNIAPNFNKAVTLRVTDFGADGLQLSVDKGDFGVDSLSGIGRVVAKSGLSNTIDLSNLDAPTSAKIDLRFDRLSLVTLNDPNLTPSDNNFNPDLNFNNLDFVAADGFRDVIGTARGDFIVGDDFANTINGGDGNDLVSGGGGNDILTGGNGNDLLRGGSGIDTLTGGFGADKFEISVNADTGKDNITDFSFAEGDKIRVLGSVVTSLSQFNFTNNTLFFDASTTDTIAAVAIAQLQANSGFNVSQDLIILSGDRLPSVDF
jgi:Ca2+-binding RTX toxin-like protein